VHLALGQSPGAIPDPIHLGRLLYAHTRSLKQYRTSLLALQQEEEGSLVLPRDKVSVEVLNAAGAEINNALSNPYFGML
jgi:hypothetical protein